MFGFIRNWSRARAENKRLIELTREAFHSKYPDRYMVGWNIRPQRLPTGDAVVTICWSQARPPRRTWWRIPKGTDTATELSGEEAQALVDIPPWR